MRDEKSINTRQPKKTRNRIIQVILALMIILTLLVIFAVPAYISSESGKNLILNKINNSIEGKVDFTDLSIGWFRGIRISDLSFDDDYGQIDVQVGQITTEPHYASILKGNMSFGQTRIDRPRVKLNIKDQGLADFSAASISSNGQIESAPKREAGISFNTDITINDGVITLTDSQARSVEISQINSQAKLRPIGQQSSLNLDMVLASQTGQSQINVTGAATPKKDSGWTFKGTSGELTIDVNGLDLESLGPILAIAGIDIETKGKVWMDLEGQLQDGQLENLEGNIISENLDVTAEQLKGDRLKSEKLNIDIELAGGQQGINFEQFNLDGDWIDAEISGSIPTTLDSLSELLVSTSGLRVNGNFNLDLQQVLSQLPNTIGIKEGMEINSGLLIGNIDASGGRLTANTQLTDLQGVLEEKTISLSEPVTAELVMTAEDENIRIDNLNLSSSFARVSASGDLEQIRYSEQINLANLRSELSQFVDLEKYEFAGSLTGNGTASIEEGRIAGTGSASIENLRVEVDSNEVSEPKIDLDYAFDFDKETGVLEVDSLDVTAGFADLTIRQANVPLKKESQENLSATILASDVNLEKVQPIAALFTSLPEGMQLYGIAEGTILFESENKKYHVQSDSTEIKGLKLTYQDKKPFEPNDVSVAFEAEFEPEKDIKNIIFFQLLSDQIKLRFGKASLSTVNDTTKITGGVEVEYDWQALSDLVGSYIPQGLTIEGTRTDDVNFSTEFSGEDTKEIASNLNLTAATGFEKAEYMGMEFGETDLNIDVVNGLLQIAPFTTIVNEGRLNFAAQADFKQQPALFETRENMQIIEGVQINKEMSQQLLRYLNPIFADVSSISGIADLNCQRLIIPLDFSAKDKAEIIGTVSMSQVSLQASGLLAQIIAIKNSNAEAVDVIVAPTTFTLKDGFLEYNDMQVDIDDFTVIFSGIVGLDESLDLTMTFPYSINGRTRSISPKITGTIGNPQLNIDSVIQELLQNELQEQILRGIEDLFG